MLGPVGQLGPANNREPSLKKNHFARTCAQNDFSLERHLVKLRRHLVKLDLRNARVQKRRAFVNRILGSWSVAPLLNSCISREAFESRHPVIILLNKHETGWSRKLQDDYPVYPVCDPSLYKIDAPICRFGYGRTNLKVSRHRQSHKKKQFRIFNM